MAWSLTPLGDIRARKIERQLNPESAVAAYMYEAKIPLEVEEVAGETHMTVESALRVLRRLASAGYVKEV